ncbi:hypothetical protein BBP40_005504 [Aspergillus hancockii]|nr:hypothetical protein BBP40_005504 [Aspergillus hancockii]
MARSLPLHDLTKRDEPLLPSQDPFYKPDGPDWQSTEPGTILKSRTVQIGSIPRLPFPVHTAHQLLYRTTNARREPTYAVTTVITPENPIFDRLLSYQAAYDSPKLDCAPSYRIQFGAPAHGDDPVLELSSYVEPFLLAGIPVSMPDYEGTESSYSVGPASGYGVLDSLRAVLNSTDITGIKSTATTTLFGYSGGATAVEWAGELRSSYAPHVRIAGASFGGLGANLTKGFSVLDGTASSGLLVGGLQGVANAFPSVAQYIQEHLKPEYKTLFDLPKEICASTVSNLTDGYVPQLANKNISMFFDNGWSIERDFARLFDSIFVTGQHGTPNFPVFAFQGTADEVVGSFGNVTDLVHQYCEAGALIDHVRDVKIPASVADHAAHPDNNVIVRAGVALVISPRIKLDAEDLLTG